MSKQAIYEQATNTCIRRLIAKGAKLTAHNEHITSSWITRGAGLLFTSHAPMHPDGTMSTDNIENQLILMFTNLQKTLEAAESSNDNVLQIIIYLTDPEYSKALNEIYPQFFAPPYPNRSTIIVERMPVPGMKVKLTATALA
ncbi:RidA family protein [Erwinia sp. HR93]|uniref:RidA family protein n=1 Tax=Erwinia sp. HR93 TaxID=3094840 RepID=UPI002ADEDFC2|nr:RidA family protein [Erwinia sp. HR93]MEA1065010.1 RidA family protein [Erwinia sp. HR93]